MLWPMRCLSIKTCIKDVFVFGSKFPERQFDDTGRHLTHAKFQQQDFFVGLIHYPVSQESMVAVQAILPEGSLQKGIISYPGHQHPPAIRATRNGLLRQANAYLATSQFLHQFAVFPNIIPTGLAALAVAKVSLKGANLFLGKYPKKLLIHIGGQHKSRFIRNKRL